MLTSGKTNRTLSDGEVWKKMKKPMRFGDASANNGSYALWCECLADQSQHGEPAHSCITAASTHQLLQEPRIVMQSSVLS